MCGTELIIAINNSQLVKLLPFLLNMQARTLDCSHIKITASMLLGPRLDCVPHVWLMTQEYVVNAVNLALVAYSVRTKPK